MTRAARKKSNVGKTRAMRLFFSDVHKPGAPYRYPKESNPRFAPIVTPRGRYIADRRETDAAIRALAKLFPSERRSDIEQIVLGSMTADPRRKQKDLVRRGIEILTS